MENGEDYVFQFIDHFIEALQRRFPADAGFHWSESGNSIRVSRGRFWGLHVKLAEYKRARHCNIGVEGYFPCVQACADSIQRLQNRYAALPDEKVFTHFFLGLLLIPTMLAIPLIALYRIATLSLWSAVTRAGGDIDSTFAEMRAYFPQTPRLTRRVPAWLTYLVLFAGMLGATFLCFWLPDQIPLGKTMATVIHVIGVTAGLLSLALLVVSIVHFLGFEVRP